MKRKQRLSLFLIFLIIFSVCNPNVWASEEQTIRILVPEEAKVYLAGNLLEEDHLVKIEPMQGRISELAAKQMNKPYLVKIYQLKKEEAGRIKVYDWLLRELSGEAAENETITYLKPGSQFAQAMEERVRLAAQVYYDRVSGFCGNDKLASVFLNSSDAYQRIVNSDQATKWGRFMAQPKIKEINVSNYFLYSDCVFSATVSIITEENGIYQEKFDIHFLLENTGDGWYVTDFTFMP